MSKPETTNPWTPESWKARLAAHQTRYDDPAAVERAVGKLRQLPPLVTSWEIEQLKTEIAEAQNGKRFVLQGGDCAETLDDCRPGIITSKLKILLQMALVLVHGSHRPVIRVGRFAGQYAKPRSSQTETKTIDGAEVTLPSYFGDLVNAAEFTPEARKPDPHLMVRGYQHAAMTLNFIRSLTDGGFADLHHPEYWNLSFLHQADLSPERKAQYEQLTRTLADQLHFMEAMGERSIDRIASVEFFTSHEGLNLLYESAQTRTVPRRDGYYDLTTHLPWIGERTRDPDGAHVEFFRGIANPVGVKVGSDSDDIIRVIDALNPDDEPGKILLITRFGADKVSEVLPRVIERVQSAGRRVLWVCDPMHGNGIVTSHGVKTRSFDAILDEIDTSFDVHERLGTHLGGVHIELTGEDVTECVGGAVGLTEDSLNENYSSPCDPRLNYQQSLELAFRLAGRLSDRRTNGKSGV